MSFNILDHYAQSSTPYLHAGGRKATELLMSALQCRAGETILEIGFGTGATLLRLAAAYPETEFFGVERSNQMIEQTRARFHWTGIRIPELRLMSSSMNLEFEDRVFDAVWMESVLGIQEEPDFSNLLASIHRVLKPGGRLVLNETIWLDDALPDPIRTFNQYCKTAFGIIQANAEYPYLKDWIAVIQQHGFQVQTTLDLARANTFQPVPEPWLPKCKSAAFSWWGKIRSNGRPQAVSTEFIGKQAGFEISVFMNGYLLIATRQ